MLKRLYVDNYKCLVNFEVKLGDLTLLLGPNGVGKSSVLDVVFALRQLLSGVAKLTDPGILPSSTLTRWQKLGLQVIELDVEIRGALLTYRLEIEHEAATRRARIRLEKLGTGNTSLFEFSQGEVHLYRDDGSPGPVFRTDWSESALARVAPVKDNKRLTTFLEFMRKMLICGLYPASFVAESASEDALLNRDGSNFAAWYRHVFQERQDLVPAYHDVLKQVLPGFSGISLPSVGQDTRAVVVSFGEGKDRYSLRLDELSDGQRALIAIYALIHITSGQGYTLFLDEPDNYVALSEIQPWLIALNDACGETVPQAVICSHHPELIDYLGAEHGQLLCREVTGPVVVRSIKADAAENGLKLSEVVARGWEQ
jgi:predicted ATPase